MLKKYLRASAKSMRDRSDLAVAAAFVGAISVLLMVAGYVIQRLASEKAHREKWKDYNDCGWA